MAAARQQQARAEVRRRRIHWSVHDTGTAMVLIFAVVIGTTRLRGIRWLQVTWLVILVVYFGLVTGNLISLAVVILTGWLVHQWLRESHPGKLR